MAISYNTVRWMEINLLKAMHVHFMVEFEFMYALCVYASSTMKWYF